MKHDKNPPDAVSGKPAGQAAANEKNRRRKAQKERRPKRFFRSVADPLSLLLLAAAAIRAAVTALETNGRLSFGDFTGVLALLAVAFVNTVLRLVQQRRAEAAVKTLTKMTASVSRVLREGRVVAVRSEELAVGDVLVFAEGDTVPADCRVIENCSVEAEDPLTGGTVSLTGLADAIDPHDFGEAPPDEAQNMLHSGSIVTRGSGRAVVTAVGTDSALGRVSGTLNRAKAEQTALQVRTAELSRFLTRLVVGVCVIVFAAGVAENLLSANRFLSLPQLGKAALDPFITAVALAVAAIPRGLSATVALILSSGVKDMGKRQARIRRLTAVETLGCTQVICTEKTGALTQNKMTVADHFCQDETLLASAVALCCDAEADAEGNVTGDPADVALVAYADKLGLPKYELVKAYPRSGKAPYDDSREMMSTVHKTPNGYVQYTKGAPDRILGCCAYAVADGKAKAPITPAFTETIQKENKRMADKALRVLACAMKFYPSEPADYEAEHLERDLVFVGLIGLDDPLRPEARAAVEECLAAGIRPVMFTDDNKDTAVAVGRELGVISDPGEAILGAELDEFSDEELAEEVVRYSVCARVRPEHKTRIVRAWKARGMVTAMTGGSVKDAPSLMAADIGVGIAEADKGAAGMVLEDGSFAAVVNAVKESRRIRDNVCKVLQFRLSANMSEVVIVFLASILHFTVLSPIQLLWIHMATGFLPGLALGTEKAEGDVMRRQPEAADSVFSLGAGFDTLWQGMYLAVIGLASYFIGYRMGPVGGGRGLAGVFSGRECVTAMAMAFLTVSFAELFCAVNLRSRTGSIFSGSMFRHFNWRLMGAFFVSAALTLAAVCVPGLCTVFGVGPGAISSTELLISFALAVSTVPVFELGKAIRRVLNKKKGHHG